MDSSSHQTKENRFYQSLFNSIMESDLSNAFSNILKIIAKHYRFDVILYYTFDRFDNSTNLSDFYSKREMLTKENISSLEYPFIEKLKEGKAYIIRNAATSESYFRAFFHGRKVKSAVLFPIQWSKKKYWFYFS